ncbi:hypothetical protein ABLB96_08745 [Acinetobacter sp. XH1741]|uniref:hypothetical protein n=1 Tax=unclassified Acinetobacter TaxID=196816 RepID=UPI0032B418BC
MKSTVLKIEEAGIWLVTYLGAILVFFCIVALFGEKVKNFFESRSKVKALSDNDFNYVSSTYGETNNSYVYINNILDFLNSYIPSNILILLFLGIIYFLYLLTVGYIKNIKPNRNSYLIYFSNALASIASGVCSLMFFITSTLIISTVFIVSVGMLSSNIFLFVLCFTIIYITLTIFIFFVDKSLSEAVNKSVR